MHRCWFALFLWLSLAAPLGAEPPDDQKAHALIAGDYFGAGESVQPAEPIEGDAFVAGGEVQLRVPVDGDAVVSGGKVNISGRIGADLYAAGGSVTLEAPVLHNARLAGGRIHLTRRSEIAGRATVAGNDVQAEGAIAGQLTVFAETVTIDGRFGSGIVVFARTLTVGPDARIQGRLTYRTATPPAIDSGAEIIGGIKQSDAEIAQPELGRWGRLIAWIGALVFTGGVFILGTLLILGAPKASAVAAARVRTRPLASIGLGAAIVVLQPVVALLFVATIIGIPLGLALLSLWPVAILLGYLGGVLFLGDSLAMLFARADAAAPSWLRIACLAVALAAILVSVRWPLFGWLVTVLLVLAGAGALTLSRFGTRSA
jgi:cytoskeletal protein CcmA (bactofilin family)